MKVTGLILFLFALIAAVPALAFINTFRPETLGSVCARSDSVAILKVEKFDKEKAVIVYEKIKELKGTFPADRFIEILGSAHEPHEKQHYLDWVQEGKTVVAFQFENRIAVCLGNQWTVCEDPIGPPKDKKGTWKVTTRTEPFFNMIYYGDLDGLLTAVTDILGGKEVIVPCMFGDRDGELRKREGKMVHVRTNLKQKSYDLKRDQVSEEEAKK